MVKPPRTMQPESVDLKKAGRAAGKAFQEDSFRHYMARKIDLQRKQFGLVPPPAPREDNSQKAVHFAPDVIDHKRKASGIESVLRRLRKRHGGKFKRCVVTSKKRKRDEISSAENGTVIGRMQRSNQEEEEDEEESTYGNVNGSTPSDDIDSCNIPPTATTLVTSSQRVSSRHRQDLFFTGIVVIVNGYTNPDSETLQRLLHKHGGDLEKYETSRITHIIAEHLSTAKAKIYMKQRKPIPVCYPSWILDCVKAGRLLPHAEYLITEVKQRNPGMKTVTSLFQKTQKAIEKTLNYSSPREGSNMNDGFLYAQRWDVDKGASSGLGQFSSFSIQSGIPVDSSIPPGKQPISTEEDSVSPNSHFDTVSNPQAVEKVQEETPPLDPECTGRKECMSNVQGNGAVETGDSHQDEMCSTSCERFDMPESVVVAQDIVEVESAGVAAHIECRRDQEDKAPSLHGAGSSYRVDIDENLVKGQPSCVSGDRPRTHGRTDEKYINGKIRTVGTDPNFLESFFASSRLSFIGSYKQRSREVTEARIGNVKGINRFVFHVDMDSFFAAVVLRNFPQYRDMPVVISHHGDNCDNERGGPVAVGKDSTSECATCNYEARKFGITKGMFLGRAMQLCPHLIVLQYDFEGYEEVSQQVADILHDRAAQYHGYVENVSCDESYMELSLPESSRDYIQKLADEIRHEIYEATQCTASIGVGQNKFLAKLGTDHVKPDGSYVVDDFRELLKPLELKHLHGIGYRLDKKLAEEGLRTVQDVWDLGRRAESELCRILGPGLGKKVYAYCNGKDDRPIRPVERKTIGAECNYGVRFDGPYGVDYMITGLAKEVNKRMQHVSVLGSKLTLKVKQRKNGAPPPPKFLGHGSCHNLSKSMETPNLKATCDSVIFARMGIQLFEEMNVPKEDVRGMGIVISKLEKINSGAKLVTNNSMSKWIASLNGVASNEFTYTRKSDNRSAPKQPYTKKDDTDGHETEILEMIETIEQHDETQQSAMDNFSDIDLPSLSQIHMSQVEVLPEELRHRILSKMEIERLKRKSYNRGENHNTNEGQMDLRFRQTNVKRMMKLAAVKAGKVSLRNAQADGTVSLTQLNFLPLELQLQVVNEDCDPLGDFPKAILNQRISSKAIGHAISDSGPDVNNRPQNLVLIEDESISREGDLANKQMKSRSDNPPYPEVVRLSSICGELDSKKIFEENILPWQGFLNDNPPSDSKAKEIVASYLQVCVTENRLADAALLLRSVRNRRDDWKNCFDELFDKVNDFFKSSSNVSLDRDWMLR